VSNVQVLGLVEVAACLGALCILIGKGRWRDYRALAAFLVVRAASNVVLLLVWHFARQIGSRTAYRIYFYVYWPSFAVESVLVILILYGVVRLAIGHLKGLQLVGRLVFSVTTVVTLVATLWSYLGPDMPPTGILVAAVSQLQRVESMLALFVLLFITFALRALGLSYRSRVFGVSLGLGIMATNDLVQFARVTFHPDKAAAYSVINGLIFCGILAMWAIYFALPEPGRRELARDSAMGRWNQTCVEYCGDAI
jgi:hypothetical protein